MLKEKYYQNYIVKLEEIYDPDENTPNNESLNTSNIILRMPKKEPKLDIDLERLKRQNEDNNKEKLNHIEKKELKCTMKKID